MKEYYKISEISKLYGIGIDSLRYYERLGILQPLRDTNGYRLYRLQEIYKLNIIQTLRKLDFSLPQIKTYLDTQTLENTLKLLQEEQELIDGQLSQLRQRKKILQSRTKYLQEIVHRPVGEFQIVSMPKRPCVQWKGYISRDEEMDYAIKKIHHKYENKIMDLGNQPVGAFVSQNEIFQEEHPMFFHTVFFILPETTGVYDFILPEGDYLSYLYKGGYAQNRMRMKEVFAYMEAAHLYPDGELFELYKIDNQDTMVPEEFLTEIQIAIRR